MDDNSLIGAILRGDLSAFETLVRKYRQPLTASAYQIIGSAEDAQDLAQETLVDGYRRLQSLRDGSKLRSWLYAILRNKCYRYLELHGPETLGIDDYAETLAAPAPEAEGRIIELLHRLPLPDREVLAARYLQELEYDEIATALGINIHAARVRCARAREKLRALLLKADEESTRRLLQRAMTALFPTAIADAFVQQVLQQVRSGMTFHLAPATRGMAAAWKILLALLLVTAFVGSWLGIRRQMPEHPSRQLIATASWHRNLEASQAGAVQGALVIDAVGQLQFKDMTIPGILTYSPTGQYMRTWGQGLACVSLTTDRHGDLYLLSEGMVYKYNLHGNLLLTFNAHGHTSYFLSPPSSRWR